MSMLGTIYAVVFYAATAIMLVGIFLKVLNYWRIPAPLKIPTTPAPTTQAGVVYRLFREVVFFESLFRATKITWLLGWLFHFAMLFVLLRHLRYFTDPVWMWVDLIVPIAKYTAFAMLAGLIGLWARRFFVDRVRYISAPSDHLMLLLLISIAGSGALMTFVTHTDIVMTKIFFVGLLHLEINPLPADLLLLMHISLVALLMLIFPFSKLMHAPGIFFSPTRNQIDNPREKRHLSAWAKKLED